MMLHYLHHPSLIPCSNLYHRFSSLQYNQHHHHHQHLHILNYNERRGQRAMSNNRDDPFSPTDSDVEDEDLSFPDVDRWDVLGLGQAMVDFSGVVDYEFLDKLGLEKGTRKLVNHEERGIALRAMDGCTYKAAAGGSLSNTLVALARLGSHSLNVAMAGSVGGDPLGHFYRAKLRRASVNFLSAPLKDGTTGTVIVLTTPDAQRTMLAYPGTSSTVNYDPGLASIVSKTNILVVEGYLFEHPDTIKNITKACKDAHSSGALVAVTASDLSCIERHYDDLWEIIGNYADVVFANSDEARALCNFSMKESPASATRYLSHFVPLVSVTDGPTGSYIGVRGEALYIPPSPCVPVDTCGAGDAYASGFLYGILRGVSDLKDMGTIAARTAAVVVGQQGTRLRVEDAVDLAESFAFHLDNSTIGIQVEGNRFRFPGGSTMFPRGADAYVDDINARIPLTDGTIRTAIDTGCGVASWAAYLLKGDIIAMSFAPRDTHEAQVQFALECGVPVMIGIMASQRLPYPRLPYPARAFDMAHCSRCLIPWFKYDGLYLIEVDRFLRPGGYWIWTPDPLEEVLERVERTQDDLKQEQDSIEDMAKRLCWKKVVAKTYKSH